MPYQEQQINFRDIARFLKMYRHLLSLDVNQNNAIATALKTCYNGNHKLGEQVGLIPQISMPTTSLVRATSS